MRAHGQFVTARTLIHGRDNFYVCALPGSHINMSYLEFSIEAADSDTLQLNIFRASF